jgi:hypothetical protein
MVEQPKELPCMHSLLVGYVLEDLLSQLVVRRFR